MTDHNPFDGLLSNMNPALNTDVDAESTTPPKGRSEQRPHPRITEDDFPVIFSFRVRTGMKKAIKAAAANEGVDLQDYMARIIANHLRAIGHPYQE